MTMTLSRLGEIGAIRTVQRFFPDPPHHVKKGIGDDCAVLEIEGGELLLVTTDMLVEGIHFKAETSSFEDLGWKALAVNLSDIAAMGGVPHTALLSIGLKPSAPADDLEAFMRGFSEMAAEAGVFLAGGDTVGVISDSVVSVTLMGRCSCKGLVLRSGARVGDDIWVSGFLGNAAGGLEILLNKKYRNRKGSQRLVSSHQRPTPRLRLGNALGERRLVHSMIDLSDGVAKDLTHICDESHVGAVLYQESIPVSDDLRVLAQDLSHDPYDWALNGGEDYELLFTASSRHCKDIEKIAADLTGGYAAKIGSIVKEKGLWLGSGSSKVPLTHGGYSHF
ncbi:MAG: thiamine-phosphate kinase [Desulfobacteria bacterium]